MQSCGVAPRQVRPAIDFSPAAWNVLAEIGVMPTQTSCKANDTQVAKHVPGVDRERSSCFFPWFLADRELLPSPHAAGVQYGLNTPLHAASLPRHVQQFQELGHRLISRQVDADPHLQVPEGRQIHDVEHALVVGHFPGNPLPWALKSFSNATPAWSAIQAIVGATGCR